MIKRILWSIVGGRDLWSKPQPRAEAPAEPPLRTMGDVEAMIVRGEFEPAAGIIRGRVLPCLHVMADGEAGGALGATRFGGLPDLPEGAVWPAAPGGERLRFLAQLDLADVARRGGASALPVEGLLSIFAGDLEGAPETGAVAMLTPAGTPLVRMTAPDGHEALKSVAVQFEAGLTLPCGDHLFEDAVEAAAPGCEFDALHDAAFALHDVEFAKSLAERSDRLIGQVLGHAMSTLEDLYGWLAMRELGQAGGYNLLIWKTWEAWEEAKKMEYKPKRGKAYHPWTAEDDETVRWILANRERIAAEAARWQLLLKVESNHPMNLWVNDADPIFVFIRSDDLEVRDFSRLRAAATQS
jgi:hypothetical protein